MRFSELSSGKKGQAVLLFSVSALNILFSIFINMFLADILGKEAFGNYSFIITIFSFSQVFFLFGFFQSGSRLLALSPSKTQSRKYYAAELVILFLLYIVMSSCLLVYALCSENIAEKGILRYMLIAIPFGWVYLLTNYFEVLLPGDNKIKFLAKARLYPRILLVVSLLSIYYFRRHTGLDTILIVYFGSYIFTYGILGFKLRPLFSDVKHTVKTIWTANKQFGFNVYLGALFSVGASQMTGIIISYFGATNVDVGYFNIASQICLPLTLLPNIVATVFFKKFAVSDRIDPRLMKIMILISVAAFAGILLFTRPVILFIYGNQYVDSVDIVAFLSIGALFYGISDFFCKFLFAKGKGRILRNSSFIVGIVLIASNLIFIKYFNGVGGAYARVCSGFAYISLMVYYYHRSTKKHVTE